MSKDSTASSGGEGTSVDVLKLIGGIPRICMFLGELTGSLQHYPRGRSVVCKTRVKGCKFCGLFPQRFFAYAPGRVYRQASDQWIPTVLQVTSNAWQTLRGRNVRGEVWELEKEAREDNRGPVNVRYLTTVEDSQIGPAFNIEPALQRMLDAVELHLGQEDPTTPKVKVQAITLDDPELRKFARPTERPVETQPAKKSLKEMIEERARANGK